jgi:hypothetical protein
MISDPANVGRLYQEQIEIPQGKEQPTKNAVRQNPPPSPWSLSTLPLLPL